MLTIILPNGQRLEVEDRGQNVEQVRANLVALGYASVATATGARTGGTITFSAPQGGTKGL